MAPSLVAALLTLLITPNGQSIAPAPIGAIDQPAGDLPVSGVLDVTGWAIDTAASNGTGIDRVSIALDATDVKDARYGDPRPDIGAAYGAGFGAAGFRASLDIQSLVPAGEHVLQVRAHSADTDSWITLSRTLQVVDAPRFCVNTHLAWYGADRAATDLDRTRANGLSATRFDVAWDSLEPDRRGDWNQNYLSRLDAVLELVTSRGLHPIVTILGTPAWARSGGSAATPPTDPADLADAVGLLAARYANLPGMTYEIWNEPNTALFWNTATGPDATGYTALLRAAYQRIKAVAPSATVLGGSVAFNDPGYLQAMFAAGSGAALDGLAVHPYSRSYAPDDVSVPSRSFMLAISQAQQVLADNGRADVPIWITEMGWSTAQVNDTLRADFYRRAVQIVRANPRIASFCAFELNQGDDSTGAETGLIDVHGAPTQSWAAYGNAVLGR